MARFLLKLSAADFAEYRKNDLHVIPRGSWNRLTQEERKQAARIGIGIRGDDYHIEDRGTPLEELPIADSGPHPDEAFEEPEEPEGADWVENAVESPEQAQGAVDAALPAVSEDDRIGFALREALDSIVESEHPRYDTFCIRILSGLSELDGITIESVAERYGLPCEEVRDHCRKISNAMGLPPSRLMHTKPAGSKSPPDSGEDHEAIERIWFVVRQVIDLILAQPNARLGAECFQLASGIGADGSESAADIGRRYGLTRAAISKRMVNLTKCLGFKPSQFMRSLHLREKYRRARLRSLEKSMGREMSKS